MRDVRTGRPSLAPPSLARRARSASLSLAILALLVLGAACALAVLAPSVHGQDCGTTTYSSSSPPPQQLTISSCGTYYFDAGTYVTQITIAASEVTVSGASGTTASQVVIQPTSSMLTSNAANPDQGGSSISSVPSIVYVEPGYTGVTIEGLTADGSQAASYFETTNACSAVGSSAPEYGCFYGVVFWGASGEVEDAAVTNVNTYGYTALPEGNGIAVGAPSGDSSSVTISGNTVSGYAKNGIECEDAGTSCTVSSNQVSPFSSAESAVASDGILLGPYSTGTISGNIVTGNACTASACGSNLITESQGVGIKTDGTVDPLEVSSNDLSGNDVGMALTHDPTAITATTNTISGSTYVGMVVYDESQSVSGNSFSSEPVGVEAVSDNPSTPAVVTLGSNTFASVTTMFATQRASGGLAEILPTLAVSLSESTITVDGSVTGSATLTGTTSTAGGTVSYYYYTGGACGETPALVGSAVTYSGGLVPNSAAQQFINAGQFSWDAVYSGDTNNNGATSPCEGLTVNMATPTVSTSLGSSTISVDGSTTDSASLSSASSNAGGTLSYYYFASSSCAGTPTQVGSAVTVTSGLVPSSVSEQFGAAGSYSWDAVYSGDSNNQGATSGCERLTVNPLSVSLTTTLSASTITVGGSATDAATLLGATGNAGGTVTYYYYSGGTCAGAATKVGSAVTVADAGVPSSASQGFVAPGSYSWDAVYSGDANDAGATSPCEALSVVKTSPTVAPLLSSTAAVVGQTVSDASSLDGAFQAGGTVTYQYFSGSSCGGTATQVGSPVTVTNGVVPNSASQVFVSAAAYSWDAVYSGDSNNNAATSPCQALAVNVVGVSIAATLSASTGGYGSSVVGSSTLSEQTSTAGGTVTYYYYSGPFCSGPANAVGSPVDVTNGLVPSSSPQAFDTPGQYSWDAKYSGDAYNNAATSPCETLAISGLSATSLGISCVSSSAGVGTAVMCTATVESFDSAMTGEVTWSASGGAGTFSSPTCVLPASPTSVVSAGGSYYYGACSVSFTPSESGASVTLMASYGGDSNDFASSSSYLLTVTLKSTTVAFTCSPKSAVAGSSASVTCTAEVKGYLPSGTVSWSQRGTGSVSFSSTTCTLASGSCSVTFTGGTAGSVKLTASYGGDANNKASSRAVTFSVAKSPTSVVVTCTPASLKSGSTVTCSGTVTGSYLSHTGSLIWTKLSGKGEVRFSEETCVLSSSTCQVTVLVKVAGSFTIRAAYSGDSENLQSYTKMYIEASLTLDPLLSSSAAVVGQPVTDNVYLNGGYKAGGTVTYEYFIGGSCSGTPTVVGSPVTVDQGVVPESSSQVFVSVGPYSWKAIYSGDANNYGATGPCQGLAVNSGGVSVSIELSASSVNVGYYLAAQAALAGETRTASGTVTYEFFSGSYCAGPTTVVGSPVTVTAGLVPASSSQLFGTPGSYSWDAVYSGDSNNNGATSPCEALTVKGAPTFTLSLSATVITVDGSVYASSSLTGVSSSASGFVQYEYFSGGTCTGTAIDVGYPVYVVGGAVANSPSLQFGATGTFSWQAVYSGDANDNSAISQCVVLTVNPPSESASMQLVALPTSRSDANLREITWHWL